jgi:uncharacterized cupin superfamily protein
MPKIDIDKIAPVLGSGYPAPFHEIAAGREKRALGEAAGLADFGVNLTHLPPGEWSSQRHWHSDEDEFVYVLEGEVTLVSESGREILKAGDCAAFPKGAADAHHLVNESAAPAVYLEVGTRSDKDVCTYPDVDLHFDPKDGWYTRKDGTLYPKR